MIYFLIKQWKVLLDILLVVGAILLFTFFDPFSMFKSSKLQATANMVTGVKGIGQLVTAEYYGEVITSWRGFKENEIPEDTATILAENLFVDLKSTLASNKKWKNFDENQINEIKDYYGTEFYEKVITFIGNQYLGYNPDKVFNERKKETRKKYETRILRELYNTGANYRKSISSKYGRRPNKEEEVLIDAEFESYLLEVPEFFKDFFPIYTDLTLSTLEAGKNRRKQIVFIGRGWVKAGFDFGKLDEHNLHYDEGRKTIHFFGIKPQVLDTDINPWFIPEQKIKGFELVDYSGRVTFEDAIDVKKKCKEELFEQAQKADIITRAQENGEEAMKSFFSLILDEPDIMVKFHTHPFDKHYALIAEDTLINITEARFICKLYLSERKKLNDPESFESTSLKNKREELFIYFLKQLKELYFLEKPHRFNFYSMYAAEILSDTFNVSVEDRQMLVELRGELKIDQPDTLNLTTDTVLESYYWFRDVDFRNEFNSTLDVLRNATVSYTITGKSEELKLDRKNDTTFLYKGVVVDVLDMKNKDSVTISIPDSSMKVITFFDDLKYDFKYQSMLKDSKPDSLVLDSIMNSYRVEIDTLSTFYSLILRESDTIEKAEYNKMIDAKTFAPVRNLVAGVNSFMKSIEKK